MGWEFSTEGFEITPREALVWSNRGSAILSVKYQVAWNPSEVSFIVNTFDSSTFLGKFSLF